MRLKSITVGNYKNIAETTMELDVITAIVSTNNYGKSNLLEAIHFGFDFISSSTKTRRSMMHRVQGIPLTPQLAGRDYIFAVEFEEPDLGEYRYVRYMFRFSWPTDTLDGAIINESIDIRANESVRYTSYLKRDQGKYRASKATSSFRKISLPSNVLAIDILSAMDEIGIAEAVTQIKNLSCKMCDTLELAPSFQPTPIEFDFGTSSSLPFDDNDIPKALSILQRNYPEKYNLFIEIIYDLFPEFEDVDLQVYALKEKEIPDVEAIMLSSKEKDASGEQKNTKIPYHIKNELYRLIIDSKYLNQPISMEFMSTGTKRIIWLIANAIFADCCGTNLISVDEIETSIHPRMIRILLESLDYILGEKSMIVTSHSPYLIQYLKPESIYIGIPNNDGVAVFKRIQRTKVKTLLNTTRELGTTIGEYLFELLSGDRDSASILTAYLED